MKIHDVVVHIGLHIIYLQSVYVFQPFLMYGHLYLKLVSKFKNLLCHTSDTFPFNFKKKFIHILKNDTACNRLMHDTECSSMTIKDLQLF